MFLAVYKLSEIWLRQSTIACNIHGKNMKDTYIYFYLCSGFLAAFGPSITRVSISIMSVINHKL